MCEMFASGLGVYNNFTLYSGKPSRLSDEDTGNFMVKKFRETCSWMSFTYNRDETDWKYEVLICKFSFAYCKPT